MPRQERIGILRVLGVVRLQDRDDLVQVLNVELLGLIEVRVHGRSPAGVRADVLALGGDDVILAHELFDGGVVQAILPLRGRVNKRIDDLAVLVLGMALRVKVKVAAVVAKAHVFARGVLPGPILGGQLAVHGVLVRDALALVVMQRPVKAVAAQGTANLHRLQDAAFKKVDRLMGRNVDADVLVGGSARTPTKICLGFSRKTCHAALLKKAGHTARPEEYLVRHVGFEPTTLGLEVPCSIQLS